MYVFIYMYLPNGKLAIFSLIYFFPGVVKLLDICLLRTFPNNNNKILKI